MCSVKIVVGLGNPGKEYRDTRHNVGFAVLDELASRWSCSWRRRFRFDAWLAEASCAGEPVLLVKPRTYMNRSGDAVAPILRYRKVSAEDLLVVMDDADLDSGQLRIRKQGGSGGHGGLGSIIERLGTDAFTRVRMGIGRDAGDLVDRVLRPMTPAEKKALAPAVERAAEAVVCALESGVEAAMNAYNRPAG